MRAELAPGATTTQKLTLVNQTPRTLSLKLEPAALRPGDERGLETRVDAQRSPSGILLSARPELLTLKPGQERKVPVSITAKSAQPGGYAGALLVIVAPENDETVSIQTQVEVLILVNVAGDAKRELSSGFVSTPTVWMRGKRRPHIRLANTGDAHERVDIAVTEKRLLGSDGRTRLRDVTVMRDAARELPYEIKQGAMPDVIDLALTVRQHGARRSDASPVDSKSSRRIIVIPLWFVVGLIVVAIVAIWRIRVIWHSR